MNGSNQANDTIDYLHTDAMGTPRLASDANQQIVWRWKWDAFGDRQVKASNTLIEMNLRYPGQYYDTETGLFYNWNRYYDPSTGRYGRSDPIGVAAGINTYVYVGNGPLTYTDPAGKFKGRPSDAIKFTQCVKGLIDNAQNIKKYNEECQRECAAGMHNRSMDKCAKDKTWRNFKKCIEFAAPGG